MSVTRIDQCFVLLRTGVAAGIFTVLPAHAQQGPTSADDNGYVVIEDIVVTAQRREERLQNVPISVTAVTAATLDARGVSSTKDLIAAVPGLTLLTTAGFAQPRIRGIGNNVFGAGYESGVSTYIDGVYLAAAPATVLSLNNIERIEVLKGPQGTLFGRNATGGLVQIITKEPKQEASGTVALTLANYETMGADAYVTGGLADGVAADFSAHVMAQGKGWGRNLLSGREIYKTKEDINLRSSLLIKPGEATSIRIAGDYQKNVGSVFGATRIAPGTNYPIPQLPAITRTYDNNANVHPYNGFEGYGVSARINHDLGFASLASITAFRKSDYQIIFDGEAGPAPAVVADVSQDDKQFSQELQLASSADSAVKWVGGVFYFNSTSRYKPSEISLFGPARPPAPNPAWGNITVNSIRSTLKTEALAAYAQATAPLGTATNLSLGFRYTTEKRSIEAASTLSFTLAPALTIPVPLKSKRFSKPTWRVSLDHRFSPELMVYASYNRGFKSGGFNGQFPTDAAFRPETLDAYEVGIKSDLLERRLRLNLAGFRYDYSDIQVARFINNQISYYNGAAARVYGVDADFEARISRNLSLSGGVTWLDHKFTDFPNAVISVSMPFGLVPVIGSAKGNRLPMTADFSSTLSFDYRLPVGSSEFGLDGSWTYNDGYFSQPDNWLRQPSYNLLSAGARVKLKNGLGIRVWGKNLAKAKVFSTLAAGTSTANAAYQAPRTYGVTVSAGF